MKKEITYEDLKVTTGVVRFSYLYVFETQTNALNGREEYSVCLLIPKSDKETLKRLVKAAKNAETQRWPDGAPEDMRPILATSKEHVRNATLRDGDLEIAAGKKKGEEYEGHYFVTVKNSKKQPKIFDAQLGTIYDRDDLTSGDYGRASLVAYAYPKPGQTTGANIGISFSLRNIQKVRKGEPLTGETAAEDDFNDGFKVEDYDDIYEEDNELKELLG